MCDVIGYLNILDQFFHRKERVVQETRRERLFDPRAENKSDIKK
jgi:hypothetical protein